MPERVLIQNWQAPGDYVVLSAAIRDISKAYPKRFEFDITVPNMDVYQANPYIKNFSHNGVRRVQAMYPLIHQSNQRRLHFLWGFLEYLNKTLGVQAPLTELRPDLHLTEVEKKLPPAGVKKPYWLFASGGKLDYTAKWWDPTCWQQTVNLLAPRFQMVQVGGKSHKHPPMRNVVDLVGKTSMRELMRLIYHAEGTLSIVTSIAHIAAAFNKPAIVLSGGREPWWWEAYTLENREFNLKAGTPKWERPENDDYIPHRFLHTIGNLPCCLTGGCWKSKIDVSGHTKSICTFPVSQNQVRLPRCMQLITPEIVVDNVDWYYREGILGTGEKKLISVPNGSCVSIASDGVPLPVKDLPLPPPSAPPPPSAEPFTFSIEGPLPLANVNVFAYCEDAREWDEFEQDCARHTEGLPNTFSFRPLLNSGGTKADYMRQAIEMANGSHLVWIESGVKLNPGWHEQVMLMKCTDVLAIPYWSPLRGMEVERVKNSPWYQEVKLEEHRTEPFAFRVLYPGERFFVAPVEWLKRAQWPFCDKPAIYLGAAMRQNGLSLLDACSLMETA